MDVDHFSVHVSLCRLSVFVVIIFSIQMEHVKKSIVWAGCQLKQVETWFENMVVGEFKIKSCAIFAWFKLIEGAEASCNCIISNCMP